MVKDALQRQPTPRFYMEIANGSMSCTICRSRRFMTLSGSRAVRTILIASRADCCADTQSRQDQSFVVIRNSCFTATNPSFRSREPEIGLGISHRRRWWHGRMHG
eukprot:4604272-Pleurochrysis_carterae.AAC.4